MSRKHIESVETADLATRTKSHPPSRSDTRFGEPGPARAGSLRDMQQTIGNRALGTLLRAQRPVAGQPGGGGWALQRAGDPEGLMKEHHASAFTYHHIIPENKLEEFWEALSEHGHLALIQTGLKSVTKRGLEQFNEAALSNIKLDLNKEIPEIAGSWGEQEFANILKDAKAGGTNEELTKKHFPGLDDPTHKYHSSYRNIVNIFNKRFKLLAQTTESATTATVNAEGEKYLADKDAKNAVHQLLMWMPGNIHRGPSRRFTPKDKGMWNKDLDDGGEKFEEAAKLIIPAVQFETVSKLNAAIDTYIKAPDSTEILSTTAALLDDMKSYSVKDYDASQWEEVTRPGPTKKSPPKTAYTFKVPT